MSNPVVDAVKKAYGNDEEEQFLVCKNCGEAFSSIAAAHEHGTFIAGADPTWCGEDGFNIMPESEAF